MPQLIETEEHEAVIVLDNASRLTVHPLAHQHAQRLLPSGKVHIDACPVAHHLSNGIAPDQTPLQLDNDLTL